MKFIELTEEEVKNYVTGNPQASFLQTVEWGSLRKIYGSDIRYLGIKEDDKVLAATMVSIDKAALGKKRMYAPRGFIIDYHNKELLKFFTEEIKKYAKKNNILFIKIDPNIIYQVRDINGDEYPNSNKDDEAINNLKELGYIHSGFTLDLGDSQSRWNFRLTLDKEYEELAKNFSKSTRKNIESTYNRGMRVRVATLEDLPSMEEILIATAERKNFQYRSLEYYTNMFKTIKDGVRIYIAYLDPNIYLESTEKLLSEANKNKEEVLYKMEKDMVGPKLKNDLIQADKQITKYTEELELAKKFKEENPNGKDIGTLVSLVSGDEYLTLYSGIMMEYKKFTPKYLMYNEHIKDAYKLGMKYIDFYGITGHFNKDDKDYGMYEFKRGFGGEVIEMIGEFTLPTSKLYPIYKFLKKLKQR